MKKSLVLAEKPSVGRDLARVLNCRDKKAGYIEGDKYIVTWALGHLVSLKNPEDYSKDYRDWKLSHLPIMPSKLETKLIPGGKKQFFTIDQLLRSGKIDEIILATDAGREGELVGRWIIEAFKDKYPIKRLWISSVTDKAIRDGFKNLKDGKKYENLYWSALARAEADWIVGINGTRALTSKYNAQLSCGRVQTPTLNMVYRREEEIRKFKAQEYYTMYALVDGERFSYMPKNPNKLEHKFDRLDGIRKKIGQSQPKLLSKKEKEIKEYPARLYDLTELQRDAYNIYDYSAKRTLNIMQSLYEDKKALTYPRTDSRYLTKDLVGTLKDRIRVLKSARYKAVAEELLTSDIRANKNFVDDSKVRDHHALIPTEEFVDLNSFSRDELNIYNLVVTRFLEVLLPAAKYMETELVLDIAGEEFRTKYRRLIDPGFKKLRQDKEVKREPEISRLKLDSLVIDKNYTKPKPLLTEASLLGYMENPSEFISSKEDRKLLKEIGGIGTVATRAEIIDKLFKTNLIELRGRGIVTSSKGRQLLDLVPEELKSPELTASWEKDLEDIERGRLRKEDFISQARSYTERMVREIKTSEEEYRHDNLTTSKCPICGQLMLEIKNKNGKIYVCKDRKCKGKINIYQISNARCPNCKKKMKLKGQGQEKLFFCSCGHRENMEQFNKRRGKGGLSKKEVNRYMKEQKKEDENINQDLFNALKDLKLNK